MDKKEIVIKLLKKNTDGLTIIEIAKALKISRNTVPVVLAELKGEGIAQETSEYDPQAVEFGWFIEHGWLTPEEARMKDAECQERVKRIKGEIEGRMYNNSPLMIMPMDWQSLWDKELK